MALGATIYKVELNISDMDRHYYQTHNLRVAQHPSETVARMMLRIVCFAKYASEGLEFGAGISSEDEPDIMQRSLSGETELWLDLGMPSEKRIRQACGKSKNVVIVAYSARSALPWKAQIEASLQRFDNLSLLFCSDESLAELESLCQRNMELQVSCQDGTLWLNGNEKNIEVNFETWN